MMARKKWHRNVLVCNVRKSVIGGRFFRTLKKKIYKFMTSISLKCVY